MKGLKQIMDNITRGDFKRAAQKKNKKRTFLISLLVVAIVIGLFVSPVFNIKTINVTGTKELLSEDVIAASGFKYGQHLTKVSFNEAKKNLLKTPYISDAEIEYKFPATINIIITEKMPVVYYAFADGFVGINADGIVTDIVQTDDKKLPHAKGIVLSSYSIGTIPDEVKSLEKSNQLNTLITVASELYNAELSHLISVINVEEISSVILQTHNGITVKCGDTSELSYKFSILKEILALEDSTGVVDLSTPGQATYEMT